MGGLYVVGTAGGPYVVVGGLYRVVIGGLV